MGLKKELEAKAVKNYCNAINKIPEKIWYHDTGRKIADLWVNEGRQRKSIHDNTYTFPRYVFLWLGPFDRMGVEVNFFVEDIEEKFGLKLRNAQIGRDGPYYEYGNDCIMLTVFFMIYHKGSCRIVEKETTPTVFKNYERQIICDE